MKYINIGIMSIKIALTIFGIFVLIMMIGEGIYSDFTLLTTAEVIGVICMPSVYLIGCGITWKSEKIGSAIIILAVLLMNVAYMIETKPFVFRFDFWLVMLLSVLLLGLNFYKSKYSDK